MDYTAAVFFSKYKIISSPRQKINLAAPDARFVYQRLLSDALFEKKKMKIQSYSEYEEHLLSKQSKKGTKIRLRKF